MAAMIEAKRVNGRMEALNKHTEDESDSKKKHSTRWTKQ
jgi:hypothetical protein